MRTTAGISILMAVLLLPFSSAADQPSASTDRERPLTGLATCHAIADSGQRAACYDHEYDALRTAVERGELVMIDREGIRKTRQSLFGLSLPNIAIFGSADGKGKDADSGELQEISATIQSARQDGEGHWMLTLDNGSTWHQMSDEPLGRRPRAGDPVVIKRGALGSFIMRIGKTPGFKARREN